MIVKESQLHQLPDTEWPLELTPQQLKQLLQEKLDRVQAWQHQLKKHGLIKQNVASS